MGRPGLAPGVYFRALLVCYFEGITEPSCGGGAARDCGGSRGQKSKGIQ